VFFSFPFPCPSLSVLSCRAFPRIPACHCLSRKAVLIAYGHHEFFPSLFVWASSPELLRCIRRPVFRAFFLLTPPSLFLPVSTSFVMLFATVLFYFRANGQCCLFWISRCPFLPSPNFVPSDLERIGTQLKVVPRPPQKLRLLAVSPLPRPFIHSPCSRVFSPSFGFSTSPVIRLSFVSYSISVFPCVLLPGCRRFCLSPRPTFALFLYCINLFTQPLA